ncbi:VOC family protein [Nocardia stercoris]|uniref:Glyoxalase n=1 Tax=Nocardia stercoris TaxID=2483361 RepID=A0A3M2L6T4_9NOCA|nr:glyoxalase [Nocardia stercoris]RMI33359.1 glyoxalase [Nocardia stercoris]
MDITTETKTGIDSVILEVADPAAAAATYAEAFGLPADLLRFRTAQEPSTGFRGCVLSLVLAQPATVDSYAETALRAGFTVIKPITKSFWGYGGVLQAPDGTLWKLACSEKKNSGPVVREIQEMVLLLGVADVKATKRFYVEQGLTVGKSFGSKYVEFATPGAAVKLALYGRKAAAKDAGVAPEGSGSHRLAIGSAGAAFTDLDGFAWEA